MERRPGHGPYAHLEREQRWIPMPAFAVRDVTDDDRFSGGWLAKATDEELAELLSEARRLVAARGGAGDTSPSR